MKKIVRQTLLIALLMTMPVMVLAEDTYTLLFYCRLGRDGNESTVLKKSFTLPKTFTYAEMVPAISDLFDIDEELLLQNPIQFHLSNNDEGKVSCEGSTITIHGEFSGSVSIYDEYIKILLSKNEPTTVSVTPGTEEATWLVEVPSHDVVLTPELYYRLDEDATVADNSTNYGTKTDIFLKRTLKPNEWNTFAAPFAISNPESVFGQGVKVRQLVSSSLNDGVLTLNFADAPTMEAGTPYLVQVEAEVADPTFEDVAQDYSLNTAGDDVVNFVPTLGMTLLHGDGANADNPQTVLLLDAAGNLVNPTVVNNADDAASYMKGFRAYFQLKGEAAQTVQSYIINFGEGIGTGTGIGHLTPGSSATGEGNLQGRETLYSIDGRKWSEGQTYKGLYIQNGKKRMVTGE